MQSAYAVSCNGLATRSSSAVYTGGSQVQHNNVAYQAKRWTQGANPAQNSSQWAIWSNLGACDDDGSSSGGSSSGGSSGGSSSGGCSSPQYSAGTSYSTGQLVQNIDIEYRCDVGGWCSSSSAWAYAPGTGLYWTSAWTQTGTCGGSSSGGSSGGSSSGSSGGANLPRHALVGYWHNFDNGSGLMRIADVPNVWDVIVVAFADDAGNGNVAFNLDAGLNKSQFISDIAAKKAAGKIIVLSFGGQNGTVTLTNPSQINNFINSTAALVSEYGFSGIDIDLESGTGVTHGTPVIANLVTSIKQLNSRFSNFYVSMAPEHPYVQGGHVAYAGIWGAYLPLIDGVRNELDLLHVQLYNNGGLDTPYGQFSAGTVDMMTTSIKMLNEGFSLARGTSGNFAGLPASKLSLGLPSGPSSAGSGQASNNNIITSLNCIARGTSCGSVSMASNQPSFSGVMTWSINWDENDGRIFSGPIGNAVHNLP